MTITQPHTSVGTPSITIIGVTPCHDTERSPDELPPRPVTGRIELDRRDVNWRRRR